MVLRKRGWPALAVACLAAAGSASPVVAESRLAPPLPPAAIPGATGSVGSGTAPRLVWGGRLPEPPRPGEQPVYVPSPSAAQPYPGGADLRSLAAPPAGSYGDSPDTGASAGVSSGDALPALGAPISIAPPVGSGDAAMTGTDPWSGLKSVTPGAIPPPGARAKPAPSSLASLGAPARRVRPTQPERGTLEHETPSGYASMPRAEAVCRGYLRQLGVRYVDVTSVSKGRSCGIDYPVKITMIAPGVAMQPAATMNCRAAVRVSQWVSDEVKPAARWKLWKTPTALLNASSYRCSRIAGSRTISEHASGNALDVRGFRLSDGSVFEVEKKGFFSFREKSFQSAVRESACRYFGTVLGPGYNEDHADHLHLDAKKRRRVVCK